MPLSGHPETHSTGLLSPGGGERTHQGQ
jgi:hypothetical protein